MTKITLEIFCRQWVKSARLERSMASRFEKNVLDFTIMAGTVSKRFFRRSFSYGGFYGSGTKWTPRQSRWGKRFTHPTLFDTHKLRDNITGYEKEVKLKGFSHNRTHKINRRGAKYYINTGEYSSPEKGKRGRKKGKYTNYAAIHNSDPKYHNFTVNQYSSEKPVQRQFMGHSLRLDYEVQQYIYLLFRGFPND
ncbi:hypothetical protein IR083_07580 [Dysgonomonas sp. GY75]|uniref:hypothetical protein n=1 Tax=Dysgonomonas sp. GY75 TaxID=2780419 RepID=UPI0018834393|nr:hypothetical protein [Dysgonomonas sp. GY75]MBF0648677.1 hypothetical protein [Dysgonomonas sp. GY75]